LDCIDCIGRQLQRESTVGVAAAWARAVHVRCASKSRAWSWTVYRRSLTLATTASPRLQARPAVPTLSYYYSRRLPVPAAKSTQALTTNCSSAANLTLEWAGWREGSVSGPGHEGRLIARSVYSPGSRARFAAGVLSFASSPAVVIAEPALCALGSRQDLRALAPIHGTPEASRRTSRTTQGSRTTSRKDCLESHTAAKLLRASIAKAWPRVIGPRMRAASQTPTHATMFSRHTMMEPTSHTQHAFGSLLCSTSMAATVASHGAHYNLPVPSAV
jgi:hypothetical protein